MDDPSMIDAQVEQYLEQDPQMAMLKNEHDDEANAAGPDVVRI